MNSACFTTFILATCFCLSRKSSATEIAWSASFSQRAGAPTTNAPHPVYSSVAAAASEITSASSPGLSSNSSSVDAPKANIVLSSDKEGSSNEAITRSDELQSFSNSSTITFWRPYVSYLRQAPSFIWSHVAPEISIRSLIRYNLLSIGILSVAAFVSFLQSPDSQFLFERMQHMNLGTGVEEMARKVELAIDSYGKIDPEICLRMAACTLGKQNKKSGMNQDEVDGNSNNIELPHNSSSIPSAFTKEVPRVNLLFLTIQLLDKILSLMNADRLSDTTQRFKQSRQYGSAGGDCDSFNRNHQCPLDARTWNLLLNSLASVLY